MGRLLMIDTHHGEVDSLWDLWEAGVKAAYFKAAQGNNWTDPEWKDVSARAATTPLICGPYEFLRQGQDGASQANHLLDVVGRPYPKGMLVPALDVEKFMDEAWVLDQGATTRKVLSFVATITEQTGRGCVIYCSASWGEEHFTDEVYEAGGKRYALRNFPVWVAQYGVDEPRVPYPWSAHEIGWTMWQDAEHWAVRGANGGMSETDRDWFNGDEAKLRKLIHGA